MLSRKGSLRRIRKETERTSSAPAMKKILDQGSIVRVIFWVLVLAGTLTGLYYHLMDVLNLYNQTPINTEVKESESSIHDFPDITFCVKNNYFPFKKIFQGNYYRDELKGIYFYDYIKLKKIFISSILMGAYKHEDWKIENDISAILLRETFNLLPASIPVYLSLAQILAFCEFNGQRCDFRHFDKYLHATMNWCYTFKAKKFLSNSSEYQVSGNRVSLKLIVLTNVGDSSFLENHKDSLIQAALTLKVHLPGTRPYMSENVVTLKENQWAKLVIRKVKSEKLNLDSRPCLPVYAEKYEFLSSHLNLSLFGLKKAKFIKKFHRYTRTECLSDGFQKVTLRKCNCLSSLDDVSRSVIEYALSNNYTLRWCTDNNFHSNYTYIRQPIFGYGSKGFYYYVFKDTDFDENGYRLVARPTINLSALLNGTEVAERISCFAKTIGSPDSLVEASRGCMSPCLQESYETQTTKTDLQLDKPIDVVSASDILHTQQLLNSTPGWSRDDLFYTDLNRFLRAVLELEFDVRSKLVISEQETYPLINLCSNIGGTLGLWIGVSALVFAEVLVVIRTILQPLWDSGSSEHNKDELQEPTRLPEKTAVRQFALTTSIHGVNHLILSSQWRSRMLWLLVLAGCCVGLGFHCDIMISAFFSSPISTETRFLLDTEELPHFSFCPSNFLNEHRLSGNILWNKRWTNLSALWSSALLPIWNEVFQEILNTTELFPSIAVQSVREGLIKHFLYRAMVVPLNWDETMIRARDSVLSCRFALKKCNFNNFRLQYHPVHKICFTFNFIGNMTRRGFPEEMFLYLAAHNRPFGRQISGSVLSNAGGIYELHPQGTFPVMGKIARQYQQSTVQMGSIEKTVTELVDSPQFHCEEANTSSDISSSMVTLLEDDFDKGEVVEKQYQASEELCIQLALQDAVMKQCDCISTLLPLTTTQYKVSSTHQTLRHCNEFPSSVLPDDVTIIHEQGVVNDSARFMVHLQRPNETVRLREYLLAVNGYTQFRAELRCQLRILTNASLSVSLAHNCHPPCHKVSYLVDLYYQKFVTEFDFEYQEQVIYFRDSINESQTNYFDNYLYKLMDEWDDTIMSGIYLYFESADVKKVIESFSYSLINFLSDLGGVLGLWFGFSVASVFEILELAASCIRCRRG